VIGLVYVNAANHYQRGVVLLLLLLTLFTFGCIDYKDGKVSFSKGCICGFLTPAPSENESTSKQPVVSYHLACKNNLCVNVSGEGNDECKNDAACAPQVHNVCQNKKCVQINGSGNNSCSSDNDCIVKDPCSAYVNCNDFTADVRCGWCNYTGVCYSGGISGPSNSVCQSQWTTTASQCKPSQQPPVQPPPASSCSQYTNCADCLKKGSGVCKWCIQLGTCAQANDQRECKYGPTASGWLTNDYQCNLATR